MRLALAAMTILAAATFSAKADRPVTEAERDQLVSALTAQGCAEGKMEWDDDDQEFEVDDARCNDGRRYDLRFNADYTLKSKRQDD